MELLDDEKFDFGFPESDQSIVYFAGELWKWIHTKLGCVTRRKTFYEFWGIKPNYDCICNIPIDLTQNDIAFAAKKIEKV